jgi:hypothetical protein
MKAAEHFTGVDPFRENHTNAGPGDIFPSQGQDGLVAASYNSNYLRNSRYLFTNFSLGWYGDITPPFAKSMANLGIPINFNPVSNRVEHLDVTRSLTIHNFRIAVTHMESSTLRLLSTAPPDSALILQTPTTPTTHIDPTWSY